MPLALGLMLLRFMPGDAQTPSPLGPRSVLQLDPLGMVGAVLLGLGAARPRPTFFHTFRQSLGIVLAGSALLPVPPVLRLALLCAVSVVLFDELGRDWYLALLALAIASIIPAIAVPALIVAAFVGVGGYQWRYHPQTPVKRGSQNAPGHTAKAVYSPFRGPGGSSLLLLRPFWLVPLLRSLVDGPWPPQWTLLAPLLGVAAALWKVAGALVVDRRRAGLRLLSAAILLLGFATSGFGTTLGVAGVLWIVMMHSILLLWYDDMEGGSSLVPMIVLFIAAWWTAAAAAGARNVVLAGAAWLVGMAGGAATLLWPNTSGRKRAAAVWRQRLLILLLVVAGAASGALTRFAAEPVAAEVGAGLSAFGLLDVRPWIGTAGLDPGHRRVAALPVAPLLPLLLVLAAIASLLRRLWIRPCRGDAVAQPPIDRARALRRRVWWFPGGGDG